MKNLSRIYLIALFVIAVVISFSQLLVQRSLNTGEYDSRIINISGRQRMLSQKIAKEAFAMKSASNEEEFLIRKKELEIAFDLWSKSHYALLNGNSEMGIKIPSNSQKTNSLFETIQPHFDEIEGSVKTILLGDNMGDTKNETFRDHLSNILVNEVDFLRLMDTITFEYDTEANDRIKTLSRTEYILFAIAIMLLLMEGYFIFRPAINKIQEYTTQLINQGEDLKSSLDQEEYLSNQAKSIFANLKQGVFLMDENFAISEFYSKETENILDTAKIENGNFLKIMRTRLIKRDLEALEMFVEHLFNDEIRETVVNRLNPVEQVELYPEKGSADHMEPTYVKISFARIFNLGKIHQVLVTMIDETENVVMRKHIEESDKKNSDESLQLLAILKVDPKALGDFLSRGILSLESISKEYELNKDSDFRNLIDYTFRTVHGVKGNATIIHLNIVEDKLHRVEGSISEIKNKQNIEGKDFLKILYQISDVVSVLKNMDAIQSKIANIYEGGAYKTISERSDTEHMIDTLTKGLDKISQSNDKSVKLEFENNGIEIPEEYLATVNDISVQLIRNSVAHGIELEDDRIAKRKFRVGKIRITLEKDDDTFVLHYADDGQGLDVKKILSKALDNKLLEKSEIKDLKNKDVTDLILRNDFSTASRIDQLSGRGQGLSLVKSLVDKHSGELKIRFKQGWYFKAQIKLPYSQSNNVYDKIA